VKRGAPIVEARRIRNSDKENPQVFFNLPRFANKRNKNYSAYSTGAEQGTWMNKQSAESFRRALLLAFQFCCTDQK
jgi:hypothetical protein